MTEFFHAGRAGWSARPGAKIPPGGRTSDGGRGAWRSPTRGLLAGAGSWRGSRPRSRLLVPRRDRARPGRGRPRAGRARLPRGHHGRVVARTGRRDCRRRRVVPGAQHLVHGPGRHVRGDEVGGLRAAVRVRGRRVRVHTRPDVACARSPSRPPRPSASRYRDGAPARRRRPRGRVDGVHRPGRGRRPAGPGRRRVRGGGVLRRAQLLVHPALRVTSRSTSSRTCCP